MLSADCPSLLWPHLNFHMIFLSHLTLAVSFLASFSYLLGSLLFLALPLLSFSLPPFPISRSISVMLPASLPTRLAFPLYHCLSFRASLSLINFDLLMSPVGPTYILPIGLTSSTLVSLSKSSFPKLLSYLPPTFLSFFSLFCA